MMEQFGQYPFVWQYAQGSEKGAIVCVYEKEEGNDV